jgi:hypothetical protein
MWPVPHQAETEEERKRREKIRRRERIFKWKILNKIL